MNKISLEKAYLLLQNCSAVVIDDNVLVYPDLADLTDANTPDPENEFLYLGWEEEGQEYRVKFREGENQEVEVSGSSLFLVDDEGEESQLTLLGPMDLSTLGKKEW